MNLVAKEYVAAQDPENPGVLVLSRNAGAAQELDAALLVDPQDAEGLSTHIASALAMPQSERRARWRQMQDRLAHASIHRWFTSFLNELKSPRPAVLPIAAAAVSTLRGDPPQRAFAAHR
jgi:trehalose 6-phosphate synthase